MGARRTGVKDKEHEAQTNAKQGNKGLLKDSQRKGKGEGRWLNTDCRSRQKETVLIVMGEV